jgi:hypothetical protein
MTEQRESARRSEFGASIFLLDSPRWPAIKSASIIWGAEALVGLLPLFADLLVSQHIDSHKLPGIEVHNSLLEECILAVVISGLALVSILLKSSPGPKPLSHELGTCYMVGIAFAAMMSAAVFYGLISAGISSNPEQIVYPALVMALASSFSIAIRNAMKESDAAAEPPAVFGTGIPVRVDRLETLPVTGTGLGSQTSDR